MSRRPQICVVGSSNIDLISRVPRLPKLGETIVGHSFHLGYGGKGANQAVMMAKLGAEVTMVTKLSRDVFGEGALRNYLEQGVETKYVLFDRRTPFRCRPNLCGWRRAELYRRRPGSQPRSLACRR